jgi:deoxyribonuclease-4
MGQALLLGSHMSIAGGIDSAFARGRKIGCTTMQVFVKNANRWSGPPLSDADVAKYKAAAAESTITPVLAHAAYLINLCAPDSRVLERSLAGLEDELRRCERLGIAGLIFHPGAHMGAGEETGLKRIGESLNVIHQRTPGFRTLTVLETTAGQGSALGYRFEHLRAILEMLNDNSRAGVCLDTCHLFAAGYPIHTAEGWEQTVSDLDAAVGLSRVVAIHVNDSRKGLGSRVDRHDHIGDGQIGLEGFRPLMNDPRFLWIPKILETEKGEDMREDVENMSRLKSLVR